MADDYIPRLLEEDYDRFMKERGRLFDRRRNGELTPGDYSAEALVLHKWIDERRAPEDKRVFPNQNGLRGLLLQIMSFSEAQRLVRQEFEHGDIATELGYSVEYGAWLMKNKQGALTLACFCHVLGDVLPEDAELIAGAPSELSDHDRFIVSGSRGR